MRILKVTPKNLQFFESCLTEDEKTRLETAQLTALGAVVGISPCAVVVFTVKAREAHLEKVFVAEDFRRRGVATGLIEQIQKSIPGLFRMSCSYQENRYPEFDSFKNRKAFFFEDESFPVYVVKKEEAAGIRLPGEAVDVSAFFCMEEYAVRRFMKIEMQKSGEEIDELLAAHAWAKDACLCHTDGADIDACLLTERTAEGLRLYYAFSGKDGAFAFLACFKKILQMVRDGEVPAYEIVCRTERSRRLFAKLLGERGSDGYLVTAYRYFV